MKRIIATILAIAMLSFMAACNHEPKQNESECNDYDNYDFQLTYVIERMKDWDVTYDTWLASWWVGVSLEIITTQNDKVIWQYTSYPSVSCPWDGPEFLIARNGLVYINEQCLSPDYVFLGHNFLYRLRTLDIETGEVVWDNTDYAFDILCPAYDYYSEESIGPPTAFDFDEDGTIYIGNYYNIDCMAIDKDGNTLWKINDISIDFDGVTEIKYENDKVTVVFSKNIAAQEGHWEAILDKDGNLLHIDEEVAIIPLT